MLTWANSSQELILKKKKKPITHKKELVEGFKVEALSSSPSTTKKGKKKQHKLFKRML
jgi:hypothetical protein